MAAFPGKGWDDLPEYDLRETPDRFEDGGVPVDFTGTLIVPGPGWLAPVRLLAVVAAPVLRLAGRVLVSATWLVVAGLVALTVTGRLDAVAPVRADGLSPWTIAGIGLVGPVSLFVIDGWWIRRQVRQERAAAQARAHARAATRPSGRADAGRGAPW